MKTGNIKIICPKCASDNFSKKGKYKTRKNQIAIQRYKCRPCGFLFTANSLRKTYRQRKPELNKKVMALYCEGNTLRGIGRLLGISYNTVVAKFKFMANLARERHLKALQEGEIKTKYVQFDEMQTFEHTKKKPLGIELSIRPKTGQILAAKVCRIPMGAVTASPKAKAEYAKQTNRKQGMSEMLIETSKALNPSYSVLSCDGLYQNVTMAKKICDNSLIETHVNDHAGMWRLNHTCAKLRHHLSRLVRRTWATTKKMDRLQMHLDLFIACQNGYKL